MSHMVKAAHLFLLVFTLVTSIAAQHVPVKPPVSEKQPEASASVDSGNRNEAQSFGERRALWLLDQLFEQAKGCDDATVSIRIQALIADLLWKYEEALARLWFAEALHAIEEMKPEPQDDKSDSPIPREYDLPHQIREEVVELIAHHDSEWARKLGGPEDTGLSTDPDSSAPGDEKANQTVARVQTDSPIPPMKLSLLMRSVQTADFSDLINQAETTRSPSEKDRLYTRAARQLLVENAFERALSITEKISLGPLRENLEAMTRQGAAMDALRKDDFDSADHYIRDLPNLTQRAVVYDQMLRALQKRNDIGRLAEVLTEAEQSFGKAKDSPDKAYALLVVAGAAARIDPLRGFDFLKSAIEAINHAEPDNTSPGSAGRTDLDPESLHFDQVLPLLARADFDRTLQLARSIEKRKFAVLAQLAICRGILARLRPTR